MAELDPWVVVGRLGGPFGVKGWNKLSSFTDPPENLFDYQPWRLASGRSELGRPKPQRTTPRRPEQGSGIDPGDSTKPDLTPHRIDQFRRHQGRWVVKLAGVDDRDAAALLAGRDIFANSNTFAEPPEDQYYWRDLVGMSVVNGEGISLGLVASLLETPRNDVLVIDTRSGAEPVTEDVDQASETLIPFIEQYVKGVDSEARIIRVDWQADW